MTPTPAPRDERDLYEAWVSLHTDWMMDRVLCPSGWWDYKDADTEQGFRIWQARAAIAEAEMAEVRKEIPGHFCGGPMSKNPHPEAGIPATICTIGTVYECIPCLVKSRHDWADRAGKAERERDELRAELERVKQKMVPSCKMCDAVQEAEQNPNTECDECGWAGLRNGRPIDAGRDGEGGVS